MEQGLNQITIINQLLRVPHGNLAKYTDVGVKAVASDPELFAHIIAWNHKNGSVRDSKAAFPVIALRGPKDHVLYENAAAHLCLLSPREMVKASKYHRALGACDGGGRWYKDAVERYIRFRESDESLWDRTALQHRRSLKTLYAMNHIRPNDRAQKILFERNFPARSIFGVIGQLSSMLPEDAAGAIIRYRIPFLVAVGALGGFKNNLDVVRSLIERMSGNELINNTAMLKRLGVFEDPIMKKVYENCVEKMKKQKHTKINTLKAGVAASRVSGKAAKILENVQEDRLKKLGGIDGNWLVLGDRSGSMHEGITLARQVASLIAQQVNGNVHLVFFNDRPKYYDVSGKTLQAIEQETKRMTASGSTSIGVGLDYITQRGLAVEGIAICTDGEENQSPYFAKAYKKYVSQFGNEPTVYYFHIGRGRSRYGGFTKSLENNNIIFDRFNLGKDVDYYSIPNVVKTMRANRYKLIDEVMETPLKTFGDVFKEDMKDEIKVLLL